MWKEFSAALATLRPAFGREAAYAWFVVVCVGFVVRADVYGITSIVRALALEPVAYLGLLHFFRSSAWTVEGLMSHWWIWVMAKGMPYRVNGRIVLAGDHTKTPKDGRKIPAVTTLHQHSETSSKPSFFRGHDWGAVSIVLDAGGSCRSAPLLARIHEGLEGLDEEEVPKTRRIVQMAAMVAQAVATPAYVALDAYFCARSVFEEAAKCPIKIDIVTRAKKSAVAYLPAPVKTRRKRTAGRPRKYGKKLRLYDLFDAAAYAKAFTTIEAKVYGKTETIRCLALNLLWLPTRNLSRFILIESARGRIVLQTTDLELAPEHALDIYCARASIETMFDSLKNTLGAMDYHFWSAHLHPDSRRPRKNAGPRKTNDPQATRRTFDAIEKFVNVQLIVLGLLQLLAARHPDESRREAKCWLRTVSTKAPSEFVTRKALANLIKRIIISVATDPIATIIRARRLRHAERLRAA